MERELSVDKDRFPLRRYKPLSLIGSGGNGSVYYCRDRLLRKKVAIKIISDASPEHIVAFQKEAIATSKLVHPNIVSILDFGVTESGTPYMVMELFEGTSLSQAIRTSGVLPIQTALAVFSRVCDGLAEAHRMGVFHRDINSSNILVADLDSDAPAVRIIDFGVARVRKEQDASMRTQGLTLVGTPHYMSPDQAAGRPFDERSEIYSVGCAFFETLTGVPPYSGESALEIINQHAIAPIPTLSEKNPDVYFPSELESIIASCLAKDPSERPASMAALSNALNNLTINMTLSNPTMRIELAPKRKKSQQKAFLLIPIFALFLLSILFFSALSQNQKPAKDVVTKTDTEGSVHFIEANAKPKPGLGDLWRKSSGAGSDLILVAEEEVTDDDLDAILKLRPKEVDLRHARVSSKGVEKLIGMPIRRLMLSHTKIDDSAIPFIAKFEKLNHLALSETSVTDHGIAGLANLKLKRLELEGLDSFTDRGLDLVVAQWPSLEMLDIANTAVTNSGVIKLKNLSKLKSLDLHQMNLTNDAMKTVLNLPQLERLCLVHIGFNQKFLDEIAQKKSLKLLNIGDIPGWTKKDYEELENRMGRFRMRRVYEGADLEAVPSIQPMIDLMGPGDFEPRKAN
ncbi:MAG: protein kinase [Candidatus Melainabacteria bacterium]|nr:protein kinase [Candidatus Melainabacteria bacterium]